MKYFLKYKKTNFRIFLLLFLFSCVLFSCHNREKEKTTVNEVKFINDLKRIKESGKLRAVVDYNSTNYFVYRGRPMGFKYELLQTLCSDLGVDLEIVVSNDLQETFDGLTNKRFDLIAKNLTVTKQREKSVDFTVPLEQTRQVLVQRKKENKNDTVYVKSTLELAEKKVHVQKNTSYYRRLVHLSEEIGQHIEIVEDTVFGVEQLVERVAEGKIDYTVCDENVARLNRTYYPNLDITVKVSFQQNLAWAVRSGSDEWLNYLNEWILSFKKTNKYKQLYHRYFESPRIAARMDSDFHSIKGGQISKFDKIVKDISLKNNWDWRLISSIIYHESRFNPNAGSWAGAYGLMQVMPATAERLGIENIEDPVQNIKAGILFLNWLERQFQET